MNVALVWPKSTFLIDPMYYPPLGLWYIWALLERAGHSVGFFDMAEDALRPGFDQYWVSGTSPQLCEMERIGRALRGRGEHVVLGGPHASLKGGDFEAFDVIVRGEVFTEEAVEEALLCEGGVLNLGLNREKYIDLPPPVRAAAHRYHATLQGRPCTTMITSFGCPYHCAFCSSQDLWGAVRYASLDDVRVDIAQCWLGGFKAIQFYDDILPLEKERTLEIAKTLAQYGLIWRCFLRSDLGVLHGKEYLHRLYACGLREVLVGVESASQAVKDAVDKGTATEQDTLLRKWCKELGISYKASIILGLPGETRETMEETREWLLANRPDRADINVLIPMPGTPLYDRPDKYDCQWTCAVPEEYFFKGKPGDATCLVRTKHLGSDEIADFRDNLIEELAVPY